MDEGHFEELQDIIMQWYDQLNPNNIRDTPLGSEQRIPPFIQMSPNNNITYIIGRLPGSRNGDIKIPENFPQVELSSAQQNSIRRLINNENEELTLSRPDFFDPDTMRRLIGGKNKKTKRSKKIKTKRTKRRTKRTTKRRTKRTTKRR